MFFRNREMIIVLSLYFFITVYLLIKETVYYINIINPIFWMCIIIYIAIDIKRGYSRFYINKKCCIYMLIILGIYVLLYSGSGVACGFAKSPYSHNCISIIKNIFIQIIPIVGIELTRGNIINRNKNNKFIIIIITILLILLGINYNIIAETYSNKASFFKYISGTVLPLIFYNALYTYMALKTTNTMSVFLRPFFESLDLILPIIPNRNWFITGTMGVIFSLGIYVIIKYKFIRRKNAKGRKGYFSYIVTIFISIIIVCFTLGMFIYEPITILSNSINPYLCRGDVVIYKKINEKGLSKIPKSSIIIYQIRNQNIAHRIINIIKNDNIVLYQTKGDNNDLADSELVETGAIKGIYLFHIKYIGFPSVCLYEFFNN